MPPASSLARAATSSAFSSIRSHTSAATTPCASHSVAASSSHWPSLSPAVAKRRFNGKFRGECLNQNWFTSLEDAKTKIEWWWVDYNERPHSALGNLSPEEFVETIT